MEQVIISNVAVNGGHDFPSENVTFNYGKIAINYIQQKRTDGQGGGAISGGWDSIANKKYA